MNLETFDKKSQLPNLVKEREKANLHHTYRVFLMIYCIPTDPTRPVGKPIRTFQYRFLDPEAARPRGGDQSFSGTKASLNENAKTTKNTAIDKPGFETSISIASARL